MPPKFTQSLAESLARTTGGTVVEARDGDLLANNAYLPRSRRKTSGLARAIGADWCWASTNSRRRTVAAPRPTCSFVPRPRRCTAALLAIVLTGMGRDGTAGLGAIKRAGGYAFVQDEATSVVWGMPGSAVEAGLGR